MKRTSDFIEGVPISVVGKDKKIFFAIEIFQYGLGAYDLFLTSQNDEMKQKVISCANWALKNQNSDGSWDTFSFKNEGCPFSSMAQSEGASLLIRAFILTKNQAYFDCAQRALHFMMIPITEGGTSQEINGGLLLYECPDEPLIFNGWIFSSWGLYDYYLFSGDEHYLELWQKANKAIKEYLPLFDNGYWTKYNTDKMISSTFYHKLHISLLTSMFIITNDPLYSFYSKKWNKYLKNPFFRMKAFFKKAFQKIKEK